MFILLKYLDHFRRYAEKPLTNTISCSITDNYKNLHNLASVYAIDLIKICYISCITNGYDRCL